MVGPDAVLPVAGAVVLRPKDWPSKKLSDTIASDDHRKDFTFIQLADQLRYPVAVCCRGSIQTRLLTPDFGGLRLTGR